MDHQECTSGDDAIATVAMTDLEKRRNKMDVVGRAERKCPVTFKTAPQLNVNSRQLVGWSLE